MLVGAVVGCCVGPVDGASVGPDVGADEDGAFVGATVYILQSPGLVSRRATLSAVMVTYPVSQDDSWLFHPHGSTTQSAEQPFTLHGSTVGAREGGWDGALVGSLDVGNSVGGVVGA